MKKGTEFVHELADLDVSDALYRTHDEVICYLYDLERESLRFKASRLSKITNSSQAEEAAAEAVALGVWRYHRRSDEYEVLHHASTVRASLQAQKDRRVSNARASKARRSQSAPAQKVSAQASDLGSVSADVSADVDADSALTSAISQAGRHRENYNQQQEVGGKENPNAGARETPQPVLAFDTADVEPVPASSRRQPKTATALPDNFVITDEMRHWAKSEVPDVNIDWEHGKFVDHASGKGRKQKDWVSAWRNWMRTSSDGRLGSSNRNQQQPKKSRVDQKRDDALARLSPEMRNKLRTIQIEDPT